MTVHLVIQGADVETTALKQLAKLSGASGIEQVIPHAFRLRGAAPADGVAASCEEQKLDFAFVPEERRLVD